MTLSHTLTFFRKHKFYLVLGAILLVATFVRLYRIETKMRFIWDEGRDMLAIRKIIVKKDLTLFGPFNEMGPEKDFFGVFHYYLMLPSLWLADYNPVGPAVFTAALGVTSVYLVYQLISMWDDKKLALWVSTIYAISPLVIRYVIWPWNPNTMPFFCLLYLIFLSKFIKKPSLVLTGLAGFTLGLLFQLHYFSIALLIPWLMLMWKRKNSISNWVLFVLTFLLANINFILFDLTHEWFYFKILKDSFMGRSVQQLFGFSPLHILTAPFIFTNDTLVQLLILPKLMVWTITILFFRYGYKKIKEFLIGNKIDLETMVIGGWLGLLIIISFFPTLVNDYYGSYLWFGLLMIMIKSLMGLNFKHFFSLVMILFSLRLFILIDLNRSPTWQENMPLVRQLSGVVANDARDQSKTFDIASLTDSDTRATRYRYFLDANGVEPLGVDDYSRSEILYIISPHSEEKSKQNPAWEISTFTDYPWQLLDTIAGMNVFRVAKN